MELSELLTEITNLEKDVDKYKSEPFAAYNLLPVVKMVCEQMIQLKEAGPAGPKLPRPQMVLLPVQLVSELRQFLQDNAFENIFEGEEEDEFTQKAKQLFLALESEIRRKPIEEISQEWMAIIANQLAMMEDEEEDEEYEDDEEFDEEDDEEEEEIIEGEVVPYEKDESGKVIMPEFAQKLLETKEKQEEILKKEPETLELERKGDKVLKNGEVVAVFVNPVEKPVETDEKPVETDEKPVETDEKPAEEPQKEASGE